MSLRHCSLEDDGVQYVFSELLDRNSLEKLDLSENNISDKGIAEICEYIGFNPKTTLSSINFSQNMLNRPSIIKLFKAIE